MIEITKTTNGFLAVFDGNGLYLDEGTVSLPFNSLSLTIDESGIATFRKAVNGDVFFSGRIGEISFDGTTPDKAGMEAAFAATCLSPIGGGDSGLEERVEALETTVGDENGGLVKDFEDMTDVVDSLIEEVEENGQVTSEALTALRKIILDNERTTSEALTELRKMISDTNDLVDGIDDRLTQAETDITTLDTVMSAAVNQLS